MSAPCTIRAFNGCDCGPGYCRTYARRMEDEAKLRRIIAKRNANTALMMLGAVLTMTALMTASFILFAIPESQRLARANQENVYVQR